MKRILFILTAMVVTYHCALGAETMVTGGTRNTMDKRITDWIGIPPETENTGIYSNGEYIWRDAKEDDTGNGKYAYPTNPAFQNAADLLEFRVTFDETNVYFLIKCASPGEWWAPYRIIGIDKTGAYGVSRGTTSLVNGNPHEKNSYNGTHARLNTTPTLSLEYVIAISSTYKGRIWDHTGKLIAKRDAESDDTPGFEISDPMWSIVEIAIPIKIIGDPAGQTWRFVIATGLQDNDHTREVYETAEEWHGGGGIGKPGRPGPNSNIYDLAGSNKETQEQELGSYNPKGEHDNPMDYAKITNSFLTVKFAER